MQPPLSELSSVLFGEIQKPKFKQLCENIFDVPRSNLLDVLDDLQNAFWSDERPGINPSSPITATSDMTIPSVAKQARERQQEQPFCQGQSHKRPRLTAYSIHPRQQQNIVSPSSSPSHDYDQQPTSPSPPSSPGMHMVSEPVYARDINKSFATTTDNNEVGGRESDITTMDLWSVKWQLFRQLKSISPDYKEKQVIDLWYSFQRQGTETEIQHMARYLLPVACSMHRWAVADAFRQVLIA